MSFRTSIVEIQQSLHFPRVKRYLRTCIHSVNHDSQGQLSLLQRSGLSLGVLQEGCQNFSPGLDRVKHATPYAKKPLLYNIYPMYLTFASFYLTLKD